MKKLKGPVCGMTWGWVGERHQWQTPIAEHSLNALRRINVNWVTIAFQALQDTPQSTVVDFRGKELVTDDQVRWAIRYAKEQGYQVCLKPVVNCRNGTWRGFISFFDEDVPAEPTWDQWFESYREYLNHFAKLAQEEDVELFSVGCEMVMTDKQANRWRETVRQVREHFSGLVTYNCDKYQEDRLTWWDAVDVISASGYYPQGTWVEHMERIEKVVQKHQKPFVFLEAGCPSRSNSPSRPNDWTLPGAADGQAQKQFYEEMLTAFDYPWMQGFMLWDWPAVLYPLDSAAKNKDYCVYGKPAEELIGEVYARVQRGIS